MRVHIHTYVTYTGGPEDEHSRSYFEEHSRNISLMALQVGLSLYACMCVSVGVKCRSVSANVEMSED